MMSLHKGSTMLAIIPGIVVCFIVTMLGIVIAEQIGVLLVILDVLPEGSTSPVSGIFVAIIIGILLRNTLGLHMLFRQGVAFSVKYALRAGIVLLGFRLSLMEALKLGAWGLPLIIICVASGLFITLYFTRKLNQSRRLGTLIAGGTGICGVTAIMAISPVIKAKDNEIAYAVANITIFGLIGMLFYPYVAYAVFGDDPVRVGLFLGTAIHDTAQVTGSALIFSQMHDMEKVIDVATVTKLTRNLFIIAVIPFVSYLFYKHNGKTEGDGDLPKWYKLVPIFVLLFLGISLLRTIGDVTLEDTGAAFGLLATNSWESFHQFWSGFGSTYMLGIAMAGVGLSTDFSMFKGLGMKPFYIGLTAAISVGLVSLTLVYLFGGFIQV